MVVIHPQAQNQKHLKSAKKKLKKKEKSFMMEVQVISINVSSRRAKRRGRNPSTTSNRRAKRQGRNPSTGAFMRRAKRDGRNPSTSAVTVPNIENRRAKRSGRNPATGA